MHADFVERCPWRLALFGLLRPNRKPPPHFLSASWNFERETPWGSLKPGAPPVGGTAPDGGVAVAGPPLDGRDGSVMPCFCRHSRSAEKRFEPLLDVVLAAALAVVVELLDDEPHAASATIARSAAIARGTRTRLRRARGSWVESVVMRGVLFLWFGDVFQPEPNSCCEEPPPEVLPVPVLPLAAPVPVPLALEFTLIELAVTLPFLAWLPRTTTVSPGWMLLTLVETVLLTLVPDGLLTLTVDPSLVVT